MPQSLWQTKAAGRPGSGGVLDDTTHPFTIGARGALGEATFFNGLIDKVRLYGYALTEEEILNIYNSSAP